MRSGQTVSGTAAASPSRSTRAPGGSRSCTPSRGGEGGRVAMCAPMATRARTASASQSAACDAQPKLRARVGDRRSGRHRSCRRQGGSRGPGHAAEKPLDHRDHGDCPRLALRRRHLHLAPGRHLSRWVDQLHLQRAGWLFHPIAKAPRRRGLHRPAGPAREQRRHPLRPWAGGRTLRLHLDWDRLGEQERDDNRSDHTSFLQVRRPPVERHLPLGSRANRRTRAGPLIVVIC